MSVQTILKSPNQRITLCANHSRKGENTYAAWQVRESVRGGAVVRRSFALKADAEKYARDRAKIVTGQGVLLSPSDLHSFRAGITNLFGCGVTIEAATAEYAAAKRELVGLNVSLPEIARFYRAQQRGASDKTVQAAVDEFIQQRRKEGVSRRHLRDLTNRLPRFAKAMQCPLSLLATQAIQAWLNSRNVSNRTLRNDLGAIRNFVSWSKTKSYLPKDFAELDKLDKIKVIRKTIGIFTPMEMVYLLRYANDSMLPFLLLGGFAGLRQSEALLLRWEAIDWEQDSIIVPIEGKTGERRVPMEPNLRAWLEPLRKTGPIIRISESGMSKAIDRTVKKTNRELERQGVNHVIEWRHNGLRHSCATYWRRIHNNPHLVVNWTGHDVATLKRHYCNLTVTDEAARGWFAINPAPDANGCARIVVVAGSASTCSQKSCPESIQKRSVV